MRSRLLALTVPVAAALLLAGCGSDDTASDASGSTSPSASPTSAVPSSAPPSASSPSAPSSSPASALPACAKIWVEGKRLPGGYKGCQEGGTKDDSLIFHCSIGNRLATYGAAFYAVPGNRIFKAHPTRDKDRAWTSVYNTCTG